MAVVVVPTCSRGGVRLACLYRLCVGGKERRMGRRAKPAKVKAKAKAPLAPKAPTKGAARAHDVEQHLAETWKRKIAR